jgi:hypothetical protein
MTDSTTSATKDRAHARAPIVLELTRHELEVALSIFRKLSVGEDVRQLAQTSAGQGVYTKLVRAKARDA